ncbi:MAG: hypothetical protein RIQ33_1241 [Bacteroidota bacterium]|jgi:hypothetical protein
MGLIREPKNVDFTVESKPWTDEELIDFRKLMAELKAQNTRRKIPSKTKTIDRLSSKKKRVA